MEDNKIMFLCHDYHPDGYGVICTNNCEHRLICTKTKIPLLVYAASVECQNRGASFEDPVQAACIQIDSIQSDAYINDVLRRGSGCGEGELLQTGCSKPGCSNTVPLLTSQWNFFFDVYYRKYGRMMLPYCCKECMEEHLQTLNPGSRVLVVSTDFASMRKKHVCTVTLNDTVQASV